MSLTEPISLPPPLPASYLAAFKPAQARGYATDNLPQMTLTLLGILGAIFAAEIAFGIQRWTWSDPFNPNVATLIAFGGSQYGLVVQQGEWYRLLTAPLLHGNLIHILGNAVGLYLAGRVLEPMVGRLWFAALFVIGALGGALMSLAVNSPNVVCVGASGAIMALFAAIAVLSIRVSSEGGQRGLQRYAIALLVPSLIPSGAHHVVGQGAPALVDYGAHIGGSIAGAATAALLLAWWHKDEILPPQIGTARLVIYAAIFAVGLAALANIRQYNDWVLESYLIPPQELGEGVNDLVTRAPFFVQNYPRDPRSYFYMALADARAKDLKSAESEVEIALAQEKTFRVLQPSLKTHMESYLALILLDERRVDEARETAHAGCDDPKTALHVNLVNAGLCTAPTS